MTNVDEVVLLGFGGPESMDEVRPFLDRVLEGRPVPSERYEAVVGNYERIGGRSPFNDLTKRQAAALSIELAARDVQLPVRVAYLNAAPFIADLVRELEERRERTALAIILASFQSPASWLKYQVLPRARYTAPFSGRALFVEAWADRVLEAARSLPSTEATGTVLIFTAHSIPESMASVSPYVEQFEAAASRIAAAAKMPQWRTAYQSRSGSPRDPWLAPDVRDVIRESAQRGARNVILAPIGFLCDHVEVLYDLDVDASQVARECGMNVARAQALNDHPTFIRLLAGLVEECLASQ